MINCAEPKHLGAWKPISVRCKKTTSLKHTKVDRALSRRMCVKFKYTSVYYKLQNFLHLTNKKTLF